MCLLSGVAACSSPGCQLSGRLVSWASAGHARWSTTRAAIAYRAAIEMLAEPWTMPSVAGLTLVADAVSGAVLGALAGTIRWACGDAAEAAIGWEALIVGGGAVL